MRCIDCFGICAVSTVLGYALYRLLVPDVSEEPAASIFRAYAFQGKSRTLFILHTDNEDGGNKLLRNYRKYLLIYTASYTRGTGLSHCVSIIRTNQLILLRQTTAL
jgi:hypothetical protein